MKYSKRYLNGFKEGFNNPNQYKNNDKILNSNDDYIKGIICGYCKRQQRLNDNKNYLKQS
jgi:hypothetical protein